MSNLVSVCPGHGAELGSGGVSSQEGVNSQGQEDHEDALFLQDALV